MGEVFTNKGTDSYRTSTESYITTNHKRAKVKTTGNQLIGLLVAGYYPKSEILDFRQVVCLISILYLVLIKV